MILCMVSEAEKRRVGVLIRHRRQALGLDQPEFAQRVGVSRQAVSKWENGQSYPQRYAGKIEAVLAPFSLSGPADFDPDDSYEVRVMSWTDVPYARRLEMIAEWRAANAVRDGVSHQARSKIA